MGTYSFVLPQDSWRSSRVKKSGKTTTSVLDGLHGVRVVSVAESGRATVYYNSKPLAVLLTPEEIPPHADAIRAGIYGFEKPLMNDAKPSSFTHEGQALFEWAIVSKRKDSNLHDMTTTGSPEVTYTTEYFGPKWSRNKLVVKKQGQVCASLQLQKSSSSRQQQQWHCRVSPGIDPVLMVCFVACLDRLIEAKVELLQSRSYSSSYNVADALK